jgi:RNA polymerase sigma-70 factor (ECF subfamily)
MGGVIPVAQPLPPDADLVVRLRDRDESAFCLVVDAWSPGMLRLARSLVSTQASAEEVLQDTWLAVVAGVSKFEGRSSLKTWVYRILVNTARRRGARESRTLPWSSWLPDSDEAHEPSVPPARFQSPSEPYPGHWREFPELWPTPETAALAGEVRDRVIDAVEKLPVRQRVVIVLRDIEGYASDEVCSILSISLMNQRVLLHRARATVRWTLEEYCTARGSSGSEGEEHW